MLWERFFVLASADSAGLFSRKAKASLERPPGVNAKKKLKIWYTSQPNKTILSAYSIRRNSDASPRWTDDPRHIASEAEKEVPLCL